MFSTTMHTPFTYFQTWKTFSKRKTVQNMENCNLLNARLPSCIFHCLLPSLHSPWTHCIAQKFGTLYPDTSPPTDNWLATNHRPFPGMENRFSTNSGLTSCLFHCLLPSLHTPSATALPQNAGTLYPDTSPPTDNSLATNYRPFPDMENRFSTNYGLPSCLFRCLLPSLLGRFSIPWTVCAQIPGLSGLKIDNSILIYSQKMTPLLLIITK